VAVIDNLERERGKVAVDRARTSLSTLFAWAIDRGYCEANPTVDIKSRSQDIGRSRVLSESEICEVWNACKDDDYGLIVRLLILTGQRKSEIGNLTKPEVNSEKRQIDLPGSRTRNGRAHTVPLSDEAMSIVLSVSCETGHHHLFGRRNNGFSGW